MFPLQPLFQFSACHRTFWKFLSIPAVLTKKYLLIPLPHSLLNRLQSGLSLHCFTEIALNVVTTGKHFADSSGLFSALILPDQKAAFGITDPFLLLETLPSLGFQDTQHSWLFSPRWLCLSMSFAGSSSSPRSLKCTVPKAQSSDHFSFLDALIPLVISSSLITLNTHLLTESDVYVFGLDFSQELQTHVPSVYSNSLFGCQIDMSKPQLSIFFRPPKPLITQVTHLSKW